METTTITKVIEKGEREFVEKGADLEHDRWARWQKYLHSLCTKNEDGSLTIPTSRVEHWERQIATPYSELTEQEKEYDRQETKNYLPLNRTTTTALLKAIVEGMEGEKKEAEFMFNQTAIQRDEVMKYGYAIKIETLTDQISSLTTIIKELDNKK